MMRLTIIGFGNQAKAWSQNLKDSGFPVRVALRPDSPSFDDAISTGIDTVEIGSEEFFREGAFALLTPDHTHHEFMLTHGHLFQEGTLMLYAHGYSLVRNRFQEKFPQLQHVLFAPKSIGSELRNQYLLKGRLGGVYSLEHVKKDVRAVEEWLLSLARALGLGLGPYKATFEHETQADLFSEQGLLCSLIPYAAKDMFETMIKSGIEPELAYFECWHELKLIVTAMVDKGPLAFFDLISPNALIGSEKGLEVLMTEGLRNDLRSLFTDIRSGKFDEEMENMAVDEVRNKIRQRWATSPLSQTFERINRNIP